MSVRSNRFTASDRKVSQPRPQVIPRGCVVQSAINLLRIIALLLIIASTFGNYVVFVGGWENWRPFDPMAALWALLYQVLCSVFQWGFKAMHWWLPYLVALVASAIPSFLTYNAWVGPYLALQVDLPVSILLIVIATLSADALPEWVLVD